jgi:hypothetical protein
MQLVRTQMRVSSCHRQALVPQQVCDILEWSALHSQSACKRVRQVVPKKILNPRLNNRVIEPVPPVLKRMASFPRLEDASLAVPAFKIPP